MLKVCKACGEEKPASAEFFFPDRGKLRSRCKPCYLDVQRSRYAANPEPFVQRYAANSVRNRANNTAWRKANAEKIRERARQRYQSNPAYRLRMTISAYLRWCLQHGKGGRKTEELLGFSMAQLREHLERQFHVGMGWHNYGQWHIDHIVPISSFQFTTTEDPEFSACWALTNLRPMWAAENLRKADKRLLLI